MSDRFLLRFVFLVLLLSACISEGSIQTEDTSAVLTSYATAPTITIIPTSNDPQGTATQISPTSLPPTSSPTSYPSPTPIFTQIPEDLKIAYFKENTLYLWKTGNTQVVLTQPGIMSPALSSDGEWIIFHQYLDQTRLGKVFWAVKSDGTDLHQILTPPDLASLIDTELRVMINDLSWLPGTHSILFSTMLYNDQVDGDPVEHNNDLYLLELDGSITQIAEAGLGGKFTPSPDGRYVAISTRSQIGIWDLQTGTRRTLLEFEPLQMGCDCVYLPQLLWDRSGTYLMTAIPSPYIHYPDKYGSEPEEVWRLFVNGSAELVAQVAPATGVNNVVLLSPNLERFFYFDGSTCEGGFGNIQIREISSGAEIRQLPCYPGFPIWVPDGEQFLVRAEQWELGSVFDTSTKVLEFLNPDNQKTTRSPDITWIDETYFLLRSRSDDHQIVSLATLDGIIAQIFSIPPNASAQFSFSLSK